MTRSIYTKWIIGAACLLLIVAAGCYWYYQHTTAAYKQQADKDDKLLQEWEADKAKTPTTADKEVTNTPAESTPTAEKPSTDTTQDNETPTIPTPLTTDVPLKGKAKRMSPHGFGPYPEVPADFISKRGEPIWNEPTGNLSDATIRDLELLDRVMIKKWIEGDTEFTSGEVMNGKIYLHYPDTVYIEHKIQEFDDGTKMQTVFTSSGQFIGDDITDQIMLGEVPANLTIIDINKNDPGIDPFEYLELNQ